MPVPRLIVLTNAPRGQAPVEYLTDRDRFPAEALFTTDLAKARAWGYPPGVRRWVKRNVKLLPMLATCRRTWVNEDLVVLARESDKAAAEAPARPATGPRRKGSKAARGAGKLNPNKRSPRTPRKPAKIKASKRSTGRKPQRSLKSLRAA